MSTILERLQYGFDRDSQRTWRRRVVTTGEDNAYGYDGLSQVTQAALGNLNQNASAISAVPAEMEAWDYDPTGNWRGYQVEEDGSVSLDQQRVHDKGNRLTQISGDPVPVLLDQAGRMTQVSPDASGNWEESQQMTWDAWGRVTAVKQASDGTLLGVYAYDGLTRRTTRTAGDTTTHCYYSDAWRPLEERTDDESTAAMQCYWGTRHRDDLVRRDRATTDGGDLDKTRYVLMDYFSPAAITDEAGAITERYAFTAFGIRRILAPGFTPRNDSECAFTFAFQGQFLDAESGFLNYGYRYYSPRLGRWLSKDPADRQGGENVYAFCLNASNNYVDHFGLWPNFVHILPADPLTFGNQGVTLLQPQWMVANIGPSTPCGGGCLTFSVQPQSESLTLFVFVPPNNPQAQAHENTHIQINIDQFNAWINFIAFNYPQVQPQIVREMSVHCKPALRRNEWVEFD